MPGGLNHTSLPEFKREFFDSTERITVMGSGSLGGKAHGLAFIHDFTRNRFEHSRFPRFSVSIPVMTVIATDFFDQFMQMNDLRELALSDASDAHIANAFQRASLPPELTGDLRALIATINTPLAVRSSSLLEDAMFEPFAGIYATKMIPNNQPDADSRFRKLTEAVKFVWASTFFKDAKEYIAATEHRTEDEKMAVIIQEVVGQRHGDRFYPHISGVARSFNYYPTGNARAEDGVVHLALGLGKTIVDGGLDWFFSPAFPRAKPPVASSQALLKMTQSRFWAVNMGKPPEYDPTSEEEYLIEGTMSDADYDDTLTHLVSTYDAASDRLNPGADYPGPKALTFAPILDYEVLPLNEVLKSLIKLGVEALGTDVEIEFALTLTQTPRLAAQFGFLQVRPMVVSHVQVDIPDEELTGPDALTATRSVLGNGIVDSIRDVIYVDPVVFDKKDTRAIATEIERLNLNMVQSRTPYVLIGFGRWGSSDPWLGIPVNWSQIAGAKVILECTLPEMYVDLSQGSHFFHNLISFQVSYFSIPHAGEFRVDWDWLAAQECVESMQFVRHVRLARPLTVKVDGRQGKGVILK